MRKVHLCTFIGGYYMNDYAAKLAEHECEHVKETVQVTSLIGDPAYADSRRELNKRNAEMARFKATVAIDPATGRAADIDTFVVMCHNIVDLPHGAMALSYSLSEILEIAKNSGYPQEDRQAIVEAFNYVHQKGHVDNSTSNQLYVAAHMLRCVDNPEPSGKVKLGSPSRDAKTSTTYYKPNGPRHFKPTPLKKQ